MYRHKFGIPMKMEDPAHVRKNVGCHTESTNSSGSMLRSRTVGKVRKTTSVRLPEIPTKKEFQKSNSAPLTGSQDIDDLPFIVPQSAPPFTMDPAFQLPPQNELPRGAEFYEWSNGFTRNSPSMSWHQESGKGGNGRSPFPNSEEFRNPRNSTDGATATNVHAKWPRKPPHHLPPLDPSVFEKKSKSPKTVSSRGKKTKRRHDRPKVMEPGTEICQEKREKNVKQATKAGDTLLTEKDQSEEEIFYSPEKSPSEKSHTMKNTSLATPACDHVGGTEFQMLNHRVKRGNDDLYFLETLEKAPTIISGQFKARAPTCSSSIASSLELLPSTKELDFPAANINGFSTQKTRAPKHSSLRRIASSPSVETAGQAECSIGYSDKPRILVRAPRRRSCEYDCGADDRHRRGEKPIYLPPISTNSQQATGFAKEEIHAVEAFPRRSPQPHLSSMNCSAHRRVRRVGVCKDAEDTTMKNDRTHARVLMKKFGQLNITE